MNPDHLTPENMGLMIKRVGCSAFLHVVQRPLSLFLFCISCPATAPGPHSAPPHWAAAPSVMCQPQSLLHVHREEDVRFLSSPLQASPVLWSPQCSPVPMSTGVTAHWGCSQNPQSPPPPAPVVGDIRPHLHPHPSTSRSDTCNLPKSVPCKRSW